MGGDGKGTRPFNTLERTAHHPNTEVAVDSRSEKRDKPQELGLTSHDLL